MLIAIIGAGQVGGTLGRAFQKAGHTVAYGVRDPADPKVAPLKKESKATVTLPRDAVKGADVILFATPWPATRAAVESVGPLAGRIVVDCTNPIRSDFADLEAGPKSGGEQVQEWAKGAKVVKCFNQVGFEVMADPHCGGGRAVMFTAGDDEGARSLVAGLASEIGFEGLALGPLSLARHLESLGWTWIHGAVKAKAFGRRDAYAVLRR